MGRAPLEAWKFSVYLVIPFGILYATTNPETLRKLLESTRYIVYPPEGPRPPTGNAEAVRAHIEAAKKAQQSQAAVVASNAPTTSASASTSAAAPKASADATPPALSPIGSTWKNILSRAMGWSSSS